MYSSPGVSCKGSDDGGGMAPPAIIDQLEVKHKIVLAVLTAILVGAAVVTVVSVVLRPARISFSVTEAGSRHSIDGGVLLNLTVAAYNPSWRAAVVYQSIFVDVSNNTGPRWVHWMRANVSTGMPLRQPMRSLTTVVATLPFAGGPSAEAFTGNRRPEERAFTVKVTAHARFKVGVAWTRLYDIRVSCVPVDFFFANESGAADCLAAY
ncbi:hypothetical protein BS78_10G017100 [Paspalum vaginatum]|nr:hypothetical protein BS78_10G017100 [Paspalum vaginatum]